MLHRDSTIQKCFRVRRFSVPCQPFGRSSYPVRMTICHYSIRPDDVPYRSDSRQTKHHPSGRRVSPSGPSTLLRRFYPACIRPDVSAARLDASQYSFSFRFLSKFQEREDRSTVRTMWYLVRTRVSLRQELQFKYHRPDVRSSKKEIADLTSTVRTTAYHGPNARIADMEIACWRIAVRTLIPHGPDVRSLIRKLLAADVRLSGQCAIPSGRGS